MGKKKPRDPKGIPEEIATVSGPSSVFDTLFGNAGAENASVSIFASDNPFRRKQQILDSDSLNAAAAAAAGRSPDVGSNNLNVDVVKNRKKGKDKKFGTGLDFIEEASKGSPQIKKSKRKEKSQDIGLVNGAIEEDNRGSSKLGSESEGLLKKNKRKGSVLGSEFNRVSGESKNETLENSPESGNASKIEEPSNSNVGLKLDTMSKKGERTDGKLGDDRKLINERKKRKRDELEREYEARKYGASEVAEDREEGSGVCVVGKKRKALDDPSEMLVTREGFDDESKLLRTVFVGNLPLKVKKKAIAKEFSQFGEIESVRIRSIPLANSKKPRKGAILSKKVNESADSAHAYVVFQTEESAQASLSHNMAVIAGNHIRVDRACPPRKKLKAGNAPIYDHKRTVFVGNLPFDVKDEELYQLFCGIDNLASSVEAVRVIRDPHVNIGKGFAYIFFKTREAAKSVVNKQKLELRGRLLRLFHAKPNLTATPSKKRSRLPAEADHSPAEKKAAASGSGTPDSNKRPIPKSTASYQGLRASKTGIQKKIHAKVSSLKRPKPHSKSLEKPVDHKRKRPEKPTERNRKRPAVANRKAEAIAMKSGGAPKRAGLKRKSDSRTPDSSHRNKRVKKFR